MSDDLHSRARQLFAQERVEGLSAADREWLGQHLQQCTECSAFAQEIETGLRMLRAEPIPFPKDLASRTQFRVRLRAQELREREPRHRLLWAVCGASWILGVASAPYVWRLFEWFGQRTGAPKIALQLGFGLWWAIPALVAGIVMLIENVRQSGNAEWTERG
jgi:hypothetical protein